MLVLLFTTSKYPTSWLIRKITKDDCSHCAILDMRKQTVIHSDFAGVREVKYDKFTKTSKVVHSVVLHTDDIKETKKRMLTYAGKPYDFGALFYLGLRYLFPWFVPKQNLWETSGMFLCTEFVTEVLYEEADSEITPHQLYLYVTGKHFL